MDRNSREKLTGSQVKDAGLALVLVVLLYASWSRSPRAVLPAIILLVLAMTVPRVFRLFAVFWYRYPQKIGSVVSRLILYTVFYLLVTPVGFLRRKFGADPMQTQKWRTGTSSVFKVRDHTYTPEDLGRPY